MKKYTMMLAAGIFALGGAANVSAQDNLLGHEALDVENFSATLTFTTDYTFRGTSFSDRDPAIQGSFDWGYESFFAGAWATSLAPTDDNGVGGTMEVDYYFGWADNIGGFDLMVMPLFYTFPGQQGSRSRDDFTFELWNSIGRGFDTLPGSPYINLAVNYSPEYFDNGDDSVYINPSIAFTLPHGFGVDFEYGYQDVGGVGENDFFADDYEHISVGITKSLLGFDLDLRYHDNFDEDVIGEGFALDDEVVFSISRTF